MTNQGEDARLTDLLGRMTGDERHDPSAHSTLDVISVLYDRVLRLDAPEPDHFLLSKGHGPQAYFAVLAAHGYFDADLLDGFASFDSPLGHHPDRLRVPGVEISSGSLGHGLAIAVGLSLGLAVKRETESRVFCLVGDAELDEGSNHEAIAVAGRLGIDRLTAVVIDNDSSSHGWPGGIERRFELEGWSSMRVDGHGPGALERAFAAPHPGTPAVVVAETEPQPCSWSRFRRPA